MSQWLRGPVPEVDLRAGQLPWILRIYDSSMDPCLLYNVSVPKGAACFMSPCRRIVTHIFTDRRLELQPAVLLRASLSCC